MESLVKEGAGVRGFFRLNIRENGKVVGDSGWIENLLTNVGISKFMHGFSGTTGTLQVSHISIGTGGVPASDATTLPGEGLEASKRASVTGNLSSTIRADSTNTSTMQFAATLASSDAFITIANNISNIGLFNSITDGSLMAGNVYASSALATNQNVEMSYQIRIN